MATVIGNAGQRSSSFGEPPRDERAPAKDLISEFFDQGRSLIRGEIAFAKAELKIEAKKAGQLGALVGVGAVALLLGALALTAFAIIALAGLIPAWAAALVVGVLLVAVGAAVLIAAKKNLESLHGPERTLINLKQDSQWAKETMRAVKAERRANA